MRSLIKVIGLIILLITLGCQSTSEDSSVKMANRTLESESFVMEGDIDIKEDIDTEKKLIKEGRLEYEVRDIEETTKEILRLLQIHKGYASSDRGYNTSDRISNTLTLRIPSNNFDNFIIEISKGVDRFDFKEISVNDVTEEFLDIQARIKTKKLLEIRYLEILSKANTVTEMLEVEKQLGDLRSDIESVEGRLKYLESKVSYSTVQVTLYEKLDKQLKFWSKLQSGFKNGWDNLLLFLIYVINIWPFILIITGLIVSIKVWRRKRKAKLN